MSLSIEIPWLFLIIACFAGYFQTVTGFGLGMIVLGLAGGFGIVPLTSAVVVVSLMTMVNCAFALPGRLHHVYWPAVLATLLGLVPTIIVGVLLLNYLSDSASSIVHVLLGGVIVYGGVALLLKPRVQEDVARPASFTVFGGVSGFLGGLFEIAGPPLIYQYYIRHTLLLLLAVSSGVRTLFVVGQGQMNTEILLLTAWAFPVVVAGTFLGRYYPPPLSAQTLRRLVFIILILIGVSLIASGLLD